MTTAQLVTKVWAVREATEKQDHVRFLLGVIGVIVISAVCWMC